MSDNLEAIRNSIDVEALTPSSGRGIMVDDSEIDRVLPRIPQAPASSGRGVQRTQGVAALRARSREAASSTAAAAARVDAARQMRRAGVVPSGPAAVAEKQGKQTIHKQIQSMPPFGDPVSNQARFERFLALKGGGDPNRGFGVFVQEANVVGEQLALQQFEAQSSRMQARAAQRQVAVSEQNAITARKQVEVMEKQIWEPWERTMRTIIPHFDQLTSPERMGAFMTYTRLMATIEEQNAGQSLLHEQFTKANDDIRQALSTAGFYDQWTEATKPGSGGFDRSKLTDAFETFNLVMSDPSVNASAGIVLDFLGHAVGDGGNFSEVYRELWLNTMGAPFFGTGSRSNRFERARGDVFGTQTNPDFRFGAVPGVSERSQEVLTDLLGPGE